MEGFVVILLFFGAIILAGVLFCVWTVLTVVRGVFRLLIPRKKPRPMMNDSVQVCANPRCGCVNPSYARFCRRCGKSLPSLMRMISSRAAVL
jgi:hypothetical protein